MDRAPYGSLKEWNGQREFMKALLATRKAMRMREQKARRVREQITNILKSFGLRDLREARDRALNQTS